MKRFSTFSFWCLYFRRCTLFVFHSFFYFGGMSTFLVFFSLSQPQTKHLSYYGWSDDENDYGLINREKKQLVSSTSIARIRSAICRFLICFEMWKFCCLFFLSIFVVVRFFWMCSQKGLSIWGSYCLKSFLFWKDVIAERWKGWNSRSAKKKLFHEKWTEIFREITISRGLE